MVDRDVTDLYREYGDERLPPPASARPRVSKSDEPRVDIETETLRATGAVETDRELSLAALRDLPAET